MKKSSKVIEVYLAEPRGFCAGVERAISIVEKALEKFGAPVYVRHEIVHNKFVVESLREKGAIFVSEIDEIPTGAIAIFSAHGVSKKVEDNAYNHNLKVLDATCPLVTKVHFEAQSHEKKGRKIILIGHLGHPEVEGTSGRVKEDVTIISSVADIDKLEFSTDDNLAYVTQTTLSVDDTKDIIEKLRLRYPNIHGPDLKNICYATQNRQNAVKEMAKNIDVLLVIGAKNSSNSNRLRDIAAGIGKESYLIDSYNDIDLQWFSDIDKIGITAGASAPEKLVQEVISYLEENFTINVSNFKTVEENIRFNLPLELRNIEIK